MRLNKKKLKQSLSHGLRLALVIVPVLWLMQAAFLGPNGLLAMHRKQVAFQAALTQLHALEQQNRDLNQQVKALQTDPAAIEGIAREQLHLTKPGEIVYTYPTKPAGANGAADAAIAH